MTSLPLPLEDTVPAPAPAASTADTTQPLAERLRPHTLAAVIGQKHLLGPGKPLRSAFDSGRLHSMILWGPPGVGKTTLARLMTDAFDAQFIAISAVLGGVKDIREAVERAQAVQPSGRRTVVFVDEVHRFNKAQQDAFLPHVESGLFTFIGATTENPSFEVNSALLSRATVHVLKSLDATDLVEHARRFFHELFDLWRRGVPHLEPKRQVVVDRHVRIERVALEHHGDVAPLRWDLVYPSPING